MRRSYALITGLVVCVGLSYAFNLFGFTRVVDTALAAAASTPQALTEKLRELSGGRDTALNPSERVPEGTYGPTQAAAALADLAVATPGSLHDYNRSEFPHWASQNGTCDTRELILRRDGTDVVTGPDCYPSTGAWTSPYNGVLERRPSDVDIDHVTSLAEAWRAGANRWTRSQRQAFANDARNLLAVSKGINRSKGDQNAVTWRPPLTRYHCAFARIVITVKASYGLSVTADEKQALKSLIATCATWAPLARSAASADMYAVSVAVAVGRAGSTSATSKSSACVPRRHRPLRNLLH